MNHKIAKYTGVLLFLIAIFYFFKKIFSGNLVLPQSFYIGPVVIHYYGITMALAVATGFYLAIKRAPKYGVDLKLAEDLLFWISVGGFIGARLYHVASSINYYYLHPLDIFKVWNGGLSIYGALIGGFGVLFIYFKILNLRFSFLNFLDWLTPSLLLGQIIGRFGNFFNYEAFGYPTSLPWKMFVPIQFRPIVFAGNNFFHPFFLYEILGNLVILFLLLKFSNKNFFKENGALFFSYVLLYNSLRFCLEFLRIDSTFINGFRLNSIVSFVLVIFSITVLLYNKKHA